MYPLFKICAFYSMTKLKVWKLLEHTEIKKMFKKGNTYKKFIIFHSASLKKIEMEANDSQKLIMFENVSSN